MRLILLSIFFAFFATQATAAPVFAPIAAFLTTAFGGGAIAGVFASIVVGFAQSIAVGLLARIVSGKPDQGVQGIATPITMTGDVNPQSFVLGTYATAGQLVYPPLTHGTNHYKVYVIAVSAKKGQTLERLAIDGAWVTIGTTVHPDYGNQIEGKYLNYAWVKLYDGTQTAADPMMVSKYGSHADYPYTTDMVGNGNCYVIVTLKYNAAIYSGSPSFTFELGSIPIYDPRLDTTAGGAGTHRWDDDTTWAVSNNPVVMIYNIMRGITTAGGDLWGGQVAEDDVPYATWSVAMDYCDDIVGGVTRYTAGVDVKLNDTPAATIKQLLKACAGSMADVGGRWVINVGSPAQPTLFITDDDVLVSESRSLQPIKAIADLHNAVSVSYVEPSNVYKATDADVYSNPEFLQADGNRPLVASLQMPAVTSSEQISRLQVAALADDRQKGVHTITLPARLGGIEPVADTISWDSGINNYTAQAFEVLNVLHDVTKLTQQVTMRAVDYADWA